MTTSDQQQQEQKGKGNKVTRPRVTCPICLKPAVVYKTTRNNSTTLAYEHRDETPIKDFVYRNRQYHRYRRCYGGVVQHNGLPYMTEEKEEEAVPQQKEKKPMRVKATHRLQQENYKKKYWDLANAMASIIYSNETAEQAAKRKIEMLGELMKDFKK